MVKRISTASALAALALAGSAQAQNVTLYGVLDSGIERLSASGGAGSVVRVPNLTASVPSRWGLRGSEDLGGGMKAVFTIESGFGVDNGTQGQGGRGFGRQAFVGLESGWGTVTFGRQYTMTFWSLLDADILGPNIYGSASLDSYIPNARADNAIGYRGKFGGLTLGATYSLGRDSVNAGPSPVGTNCAGESLTDKSACREWSAMAKYDTATWGGALAYDEIKGGAGAFGGLTSSALKDTRLSLNGWVKVGDTKIGGGLLRRNNDGAPTNPKSDILYLGAAYPITQQFVLDGEVLRLHYKTSGENATILAARGTYNFSKRSAAYVTAGRIGNSGNLAVSVSGGQVPAAAPVAGGSQLGLMVGVRHYF